MTTLAIALDFQMKAAQALQSVVSELGNVEGAAQKAGKQLDDLEGKGSKIGGALKGSLGAGKTAIEGIGHAAKGALGPLGEMSKIAGGFVIGQGLLKAPGFLMDAAKGAAADAAATERLHKTIQNLGGDFASMNKQVDQAITAGQRLAFTDDEVRDSYQYLAQATNSHEEALKRQKVAMDFARGANIPLSQAMKLVGKVNEENVDTFKRLGIEMDKNATEAEVMANLQKRFGGQAEQYAKSTEGQFKQAQIAFAEMKESLGGALLPIISKVGIALAENLPQIQEKLSAAFDAIGPKVQAAMAIAGQAIQAAMPVIQQAIATIGQKFDEWGPKIQAAWAAAQPILAQIGTFIVETVVPALQQLGGKIQEEFGKFQAYYQSDIKPAIDNIRTAIEAVISYIVANWPKIEAVIRPVMEQVRTVVETALGVITNVIQIIIDLIGGDFSGAWTNLKELVGVVWTGIQETVTNGLELLRGLGGLALEVAKDLGSKLAEGVVEGIKGVADHVGDMTQSLINAFKSAINAALAWLHNNVTISIPGFDPPGPGSIPGFDWQFPLLQFARGGRVPGDTGNQRVLVGERGPEVVDLPVGSRVYSNAQSQAMFGLQAFALGGTVAPNGHNMWQYHWVNNQAVNPAGAVSGWPFAGRPAGAGLGNRITTQPWGATNIPAGNGLPPAGLQNAFGVAGPGIPQWFQNSDGTWEFRVPESSQLPLTYGEQLGIPGGPRGVSNYMDQYWAATMQQAYRNGFDQPGANWANWDAGLWGRGIGGHQGISMTEYGQGRPLWWDPNHAMGLSAPGVAFPDHWVDMDGSGTLAYMGAPGSAERARHEAEWAAARARGPLSGDGHPNNAHRVMFQDGSSGNAFRQLQGQDLSDYYRMQSNAFFWRGTGMWPWEIQAGYDALGGQHDPSSVYYGGLSRGPHWSSYYTGHGGAAGGSLAEMTSSGGSRSRQSVRQQDGIVVIQALDGPSVDRLLRRKAGAVYSAAQYAARRRQG